MAFVDELIDEYVTKQRNLLQAKEELMIKEFQEEYAVLCENIKQPWKIIEGTHQVEYDGIVLEYHCMGQPGVKQWCLISAIYDNKKYINQWGIRYCLYENAINEEKLAEIVLDLIDNVLHNGRGLSRHFVRNFQIYYNELRNL